MTRVLTILAAVAAFAVSVAPAASAAWYAKFDQPDGVKAPAPLGLKAKSTVKNGIWNNGDGNDTVTSSLR
jgi:hypothetical protein